jgi:type I restriction enzyme R subunit
MKPEEKARQQIDRLLEAAGWKVQDYRELNLSASLGVVVRYFPLKEQLEADYLLFVDRKAVGVVEAKPTGTTLSGVAEQTTKYLASIPANVPTVQLPLPFAYESTGVETFFRDSRDPEPCSRRVFAFHQPETLKEWLAQEDSLRGRLQQTPSLVTQGLRECQIDAIKNLEVSLADARPRALVQMATGSGKTFMAVSLIYRLIKFANARRVLFLVDRNNLGRQTHTEFQQYLTPDDGRKFTELYNVQRLSSNTFDPVNRVCITTIQRLYSMLRGEPELDPELEEHSLFDLPALPQRPKDVAYNPQIPIETFDFIITDECHRSIYNLWRQVLEYFDAFIIGLTATPSLQTLGYFNQNLVMEYSHERAVADGVNVGYEVYRIKTDITERGSRVESGYYVDKRDRLTRKLRWEQLNDDLEYAAAQLDRDVVAKDQIRTVIRTFKEKLFTEIFPGRTEVPKTLIFAKDDSHAEDIVHLVREEFGKGNEFCKKITYLTYKATGEKTEDLIASFRNSYHPRIAVTVDMISTGTDIKPIECLLFMRDIRSPVYFEQMKGRGTRTISATDLKAVTPDGQHKTHFVIVDAVGVCESDKTDSRPLERKKGVPFDKLLISVALGNRDEDTLTSLAGRLARLDAGIDGPARREIAAVAGGRTLPEMINRLLDAVDPDKQMARAREIFQTAKPGVEQIQQATAALINEACAPIENPTVRNKIIEIKKRHEQTIDTVSQDTVISTGFTQVHAQGVIESFRKFMDENKDELTALQIFYSLPYGQRHLTHSQIEELAGAIKKPPYSLTQEHLWQAYERLEQARVRGAGTKRILTDLISLVRFALGEADTLEPWPETIDRRFESWLAAQKLLGRDFTPEQLEWLKMIKEHVAASLTVEVEDFELAPFFEKGGPVKAMQLFGPDLPKILTEVNKALAA